MIGFFKCFSYLAILSFASFIVGRLLPKGLFNYDRFPFKPFKFEKDGSIYIKTGVRKWKNILPDMSVLLSSWMPSKRLPTSISAAQVEIMLKETCVAEWTHQFLSALGFVCMLIWDSMGGFIVSLLYAIGNVPYVIIQRYNRPKLLMLLKRLRKKEKISDIGMQGIVNGKSDYIELQYGARS